MKHKRTIKQHCSRALRGIAVTLITISLAGFAGSIWWVFELLSHFRLQYACALAVGIVLMVMIRRWAIAAVSLVALALNAYEVGCLYLNFNAAANNPQGRTLHVVHLNAWHNRNHQPELIANYIQRSKPDVVLILETNKSIIEALDRLMPEYQLVAQPTPEKPFRSVILLKNDPTPWKLVSLNELEYQVGNSETIGVGTTIELADSEQLISILHPHVTAPGTSSRHMARQSDFAAIATWVHSNPDATIVIGDFNATPWSVSFRTLLAATGLCNSQQGFGFQGTWPRRPPRLLTWALTIPIDHCLHTRSITTMDRRIGPYVGSDHLPLEVVLDIPKLTPSQ